MYVQNGWKKVGTLLKDCRMRAGQDFVLGHSGRMQEEISKSVSSVEDLPGRMYAGRRSTSCGCGYEMHVSQVASQC